MPWLRYNEARSTRQLSFNEISHFLICRCANCELTNQEVSNGISSGILIVTRAIVK